MGDDLQAEDDVGGGVTMGAMEVRPYPRDPSEWQGMPLRAGPTTRCRESSDCKMTRACLNGWCLPCEADVQCARGEVCVLNHCLLEQNVSCRSRKDCARDALCVMSGYTSGGRNNSSTKAMCLALDGENPFAE